MLARLRGILVRGVADPDILWLTIFLASGKDADDKFFTVMNHTTFWGLGETFSAG
jgi:hypothetical protein